MEHGKFKTGLIHDRRSAAIALFLTGFIATLSFRTAFSHAPQKSHWLVSLDFTSLPI
jgi:hypothetical protein